MRVLDDYLLELMANIGVLRLAADVGGFARIAFEIEQLQDTRAKCPWSGKGI